MKEYYQKKAESLKSDIEHINRHMHTTNDEEERNRLKNLKQRLVTERMNYLGAIDAAG